MSHDSILYTIGIMVHRIHRQLQSAICRVNAIINSHSWRIIHNGLTFLDYSHISYEGFHARVSMLCALKISAYLCTRWHYRSFSSGLCWHQAMERGQEIDWIYVARHAYHLKAIIYRFDVRVYVWRMWRYLGLKLDTGKLILDRIWWYSLAESKSTFKFAVISSIHRTICHKCN